MGVYKRGGTWWYEFIFSGKRVRESAHTSSKTIAKESEKDRKAGTGAHTGRVAVRET